MGIEVRLKRESGEVLAEVDDHQMALSRATSGPLTSTRLLRYLMPWGDAVFNQAQANDLKDDVRELLRTHSGTPSGQSLLRSSRSSTNCRRKRTPISGSLATERRRPGLGTELKRARAQLYGARCA
jgi:hypothetical protein